MKDKGANCQLKLLYTTVSASVYYLIFLVDHMIQSVSTQEPGSHLSAARLFVLTQKYPVTKATKSKV